MIISYNTNNGCKMFFLKYNIFRNLPVKKAKILEYLFCIIE